MAESQFIRTVLFGGYDKNDVDKRLNYLYDIVFDSKNKLREAKVAIDRLRGGASDDEAMTSVAAEERAKVTELQIKNQNLVEKSRSLADELLTKNQDIANLKAELDAVKAKLGEAEAKLASENGTNSGAMLNMVFQQAQSSADLIVSTAKKQAEDLESDSKKLAENVVIEANNKAKMIIYDAEVKAADIIKEAKEKSSVMDVASDNVKAQILDNVDRMSKMLGQFKDIFGKFENAGAKMISDSENVLGNMSSDLKSNGVPVFRSPERFESDMVEAPVLDDIDNDYATGNPDHVDAAKKNDALEKLKARAESLGEDKRPENKPDNKSAKKKTDLDELMKKAASMK